VHAVTYKDVSPLICLEVGRIERPISNAHPPSIMAEGAPVMLWPSSPLGSSPPCILLNERLKVEALFVSPFGASDSRAPPKVGAACYSSCHTGNWDPVSFLLLGYIRTLRPSLGLSDRDWATPGLLPSL